MLLFALAVPDLQKPPGERRSLQNLPEAKVVKVIDGDTLDVLLKGEEIRIRLLGIDTPEKGEPLYKEAKERLAELASAVVYVEADAEKKDRYGRYLFWLYSEDGQLINAELVKEGLADCYYRPSFRGRRHALELLYQAFEACQKKIGIWSESYGKVALIAPNLVFLILPFGFYSQEAGFFYFF